jgi:hypothetical protein
VGVGRSGGRTYVCLERVIDMMRRDTTRHDTRKSVSLVLVPAPVGWSEGKDEARGKGKCWVTLA